MLHSSSSPHLKSNLPRKAARLEAASGHNREQSYKPYQKIFIACSACISTVSGSSSSSSSRGWCRGSAVPTTPAVQLRFAGSKSRRSVVSCAVVRQLQQQRLWDYQGTCIKQLSLRELELLHRLSFGHRNQRTYLIVLFKSDSPACRAFEAEVERLASGLKHEPAFVAGALDVSSKETASFASNMLKVDHVPAVLLYPEAARGCLKFLGPDMSAVGMLTAINKARKAALPPSSDSPGAASWQLIEAATPLSVTALRAAAASGDRDTVVAALQQQMQPIQPTPLLAQQVSAPLTQGRVQLWVGLLLCSLLFLAWDVKLSDMWEDWCLSRRQQARLQGKRFSAQENLDDIVTYMMKGFSGDLQQPATAQSAHPKSTAASLMPAGDRPNAVSSGSPADQQSPDPPSAPSGLPATRPAAPQDNGP